MAWQQLIARVRREQVPEIEKLLELAGAEAIALEDAGEAPLFEPSPGETPLWPIVELKALFGPDADMTGVQALLMRSPQAPLRVTARTLDERETEGSEGGRFAPLRVGPRLWLISPDDAPPADGAEVLRLHRGLAFGTGEHPTTALCLEWLESSLVPGGVVLDYGCGSGVLALAALRLGASRAFAVDDDPQALVATARNAALNGFDDKVWVGLPEQLPDFRADVLLANILLRPLTGLAPLFGGRVVTFGFAVLSGVLTPQAGELEAAYAPWFERFATSERDGWIRMTARKRPCFD